MSRRGSGHASDTQRRPSDQRPPPQAYHEDSYHRSSNHEPSDDEISYMRANRHVRIPGLTPHHDPYRRIPSGSLQYPLSFTVLGNAGPDVGLDPLDEPLAQLRIRKAPTSGLDTERRSPSWPYREPAKPAMFTPASTSVCSYPINIEIPSGRPARIDDRREPVDRPVGNEPEVVASGREDDLRPQVLRTPLDPYRTQSNIPRPDLQRQQPKPRLSAHSDPSTTNDDRNKHPRYAN